MRAQLTYPSLLVLAWFGLASRPAHAQSTCSTDSECVKGWTCQVSGGVACGSPACAPGEKCEEQPSDCTSAEFKSCQPGACRADSDCADGMVCYTHTESNCAPTPCASGQECAEQGCEPQTKTESACLPRYLLPCTSASDCGSGFQCEPAGEECECSGSAGGSDPSAGGAPPAAPSEPSCTCKPSPDLRCNAATVTCATDSDCSTGWTCVTVASTSDCASPAPNPGSGAQGGGATGGAAPAPDCRPSADIKQCVPPYYALVQGVKGGARDSAGTPTLAYGGATSSSESGAVPPTAANGKDSATSSAGCSVTRGSRTGSALGLLGVLGLFGVLRRRRGS